MLDVDSSILDLECFLCKKEFKSTFDIGFNFCEHCRMLSNTSKKLYELKPIGLIILEINNYIKNNKHTILDRDVIFVDELISMLQGVTNG